MVRVRFITKGNKIIEIVDEPWDTSNDAEYYILYETRYNFVNQANLLLKRFDVDVITGKIAQILIERGLLCPAI